jgi:hypothetical protein
MVMTPNVLPTHGRRFIGVSVLSPHETTSELV